MDFFIPAYLQKRVLRYALSRIELLDLDKLDLDTLQVGWGRNSTVELQDVAFKRDKLAALLRLPDRYSIELANIRSLRLTVPADLYTSSIQVQITGIFARIRVLDDNEFAEKPADVTLPTPRDLAKSFLEQVPTEQEAELESQIAADLRQSVVSAGADEDDNEPGTGIGLQLPNFLAEFLRGMVERLRVNIEDICIQLELNVAIPSEDHKDTRHTPTAVRLVISNIDVSNVDNAPQDSADKFSSTVKIGKRHVTVSTIQLNLLSQSQIFEQVSEILQQEGLDVDLTKQESPTSPTQSFKDVSWHSSAAEAQERPLFMEQSIASSHDSRFADADEDDEYPYFNTEPSSRHIRRPSSVPSWRHRFGDHSYGTNPFDDYENDALEHQEPFPSFSQEDGSSSIRTSTKREDHAWHHEEAQAARSDSHKLKVTERPSNRFPGGFESTFLDSSTHVSNTEDNADSHEASGTPMDESLLESRYFSNADAKSIYMSVLNDSPEAESQTVNVPGGWGSDLDQSTAQESNVTGEGTEVRKLYEPRELEDPFSKAGVVSKTICAIETIQIWIPESLDLDTSASDVLRESRLYNRDSASAIDSTFLTPGVGDDVKPDAEVEVGPVYLTMDLSILKVLLQVSKKLKVTAEDPHNHDADARSPLTLILGVKLSRVEILLRARSAEQSEGSLNIASFSLVLEYLAVKSDGLQTLLDVGKLVLKHQDDVIIDFSKSATVKPSMQDRKASNSKDVTLLYRVGVKANEIHISTLPIRINANLSRLDDAIGTLGSFSTLLSSSLEPPKSPEKISRRTVRFDNEAPSQKSRPAVKMNVRVGGAQLVVASKACSFTFRSTAIKVVAREALLGVQIDEILLLGPYHGDEDMSSIEVTLHNTSLKYLAHPEEADLDRMIELLAPSQDKFGDEDDFLSETLIRQRKKGAALRVNIEHVGVDVHELDIADSASQFLAELMGLSVTKYLPEESRPGMLTVGFLQRLTLRIDDVPKFGPGSLQLRDADFAHVGIPSLLALKIDGVLGRGDKDVIRPLIARPLTGCPPMLRVRYIGDELEPIFKVKLWNTMLEYDAALLLKVVSELDAESSDVASSVATLTGKLIRHSTSSLIPNANIEAHERTQHPMALSLFLRECSVGLKPLGEPSKAMFVLSSATVNFHIKQKEITLGLELKKASLHLIDNVEKVTSSQEPNSLAMDHLTILAQQGFVSMAWISVATLNLKQSQLSSNKGVQLDAEFGNELLVFESCADSTQTLGDLFSRLSPPRPPSKEQKYRTEVTSIEDMMASFTGDAYATTFQDEVFTGEASETIDDDEMEDAVEEGFELDLDNLGDLNGLDFGLEVDMPEDVEDSVIINATLADDQPTSPTAEGSDLETSNIVGAIEDDNARLPPAVIGIANKWDSSNNRYIHVSKTELAECPINVRVRNVHFIWNLFDGYDWEQTRNTISNAVADVERKAEERRVARAGSRIVEEEDESVIGDFLFNSIYIGVPVNHDPRELRTQINRNIDDMMSETASQATTITARPASVVGRPSAPKSKQLRLERSSRHKIAFEIKGLSADIFTFPPGAETQASIDVRVGDFEIFDHVPSSTWKKFATYMQDSGPREDKKPMLHLEICSVQPVPELTASELVLRVTVLPLRLHVDQDALDFLTRFFEFKTEAAKQAPEQPTEQPYLQRVEVLPVLIKLDYKPKSIDFAGLRSGRTTEFMNFFILDAAKLTLRHAIIYGCSGMDKLHKSLEDVWMPDVKRNQLPSVLSGLNGIRTVVNIGAGVRDLVVVPVREYQKDGRIVRSVRKGAMAFARGAGGELTRFGAKLAVGAQGILQNAEGFLQGPQRESSQDRQEESSNAERRAISAYASQPAGILQGLKGAARSLERDLLVTRDAVIAISGEVREGGGIGAIARGAPTLVLRPMIGVSKAVGQTLMGATNSVDPESRRRLEDKYKKY